MRFRTAYTLSFLSDPRHAIEFPVRVEIEHKSLAIEATSGDGKTATAFLEGQVDPIGLKVETGPTPLNGSQPARGVVIPEQSDFTHLLARVIHVLSFLTDIPIRYSHGLEEGIFIPEGPEDEVCLQQLGTQRGHVNLSAIASTRTFEPSEVARSALEPLLSKEIGLVVYSQALLVQEPMAQFRELWRVLESAFGAKDRKLTRLLANYEPATNLGFESSELEGILALRGRASHAESKAGMEEYRRVLSETQERLPRLKCLVEQVLLTKKSWGSRTLGVERLASLSGYVETDGTPVLTQRAAWGS